LSHDTAFLAPTFLWIMHHLFFLSRKVSVMCQPKPVAAMVTVMVSSVFAKIPVRSCGIAAAAAAAASAADGAQRKHWQYVHITSTSFSEPSPPLVLLQRHPTVTSRPNICTSTLPLHPSLPRDRSRWFVRGTCMIGAGRRGAPYFTYLGLPFILPRAVRRTVYGIRP
jgi:hypothetical protein